MRLLIKVSTSVIFLLPGCIIIFHLCVCLFFPPLLWDVLASEFLDVNHRVVASLCLRVGCVSENRFTKHALLKRKVEHENEQDLLSA